MKNVVNIIAVLVLLVGAGVAQAALLVDQQQTSVLDGWDAWTNGGDNRGQGFTAGVNRIDAVEFYLHSQGAGGDNSLTYTVELYNALAGWGAEGPSVPDVGAGLLASADLLLGVSSPIGWTQWTFPSPVTLTPGNGYSIVIVPAGTSSSSFKARWGYAWPPDGDYAAGASTYRGLPEQVYYANAGVDLAFKTLYIPEPATLLVLLAGAGLTLSRRR